MRNLTAVLVLLAVILPATAAQGPPPNTRTLYFDAGKYGGDVGLDEPLRDESGVEVPGKWAIVGSIGEHPDVQLVRRRVDRGNLTRYSAKGPGGQRATVTFRGDNLRTCAIRFRLGRRVVAIDRRDVYSVQYGS